MKVQVNTDNHIEGSERLIAFLNEEVEDSLKNFSDRVTRVEVHLADENSHKMSANDKKCTIEARLAGLAPVVVTDQSDTLEKAIAGATEKIKRAVENTIGKLGH